MTSEMANIVNSECYLFPNAGFFGDKVVYEVLIRNAVRASTAEVIGVEWANDPFSMLDFPVPPSGVLVLSNGGNNSSQDLADLVEILRTAPKQWHLSTFTTKHTPESLGGNLARVLAVFNHDDLWEAAGHLASKGEYPNLAGWRGARIGDSSIRRIAIHLRNLVRDSEKNLKQGKYIEIAKRLDTELGLRVQWVGLEQDLPSHSEEQLSASMLEASREPMSIRPLIDTLQNSHVYIGGDSGPTHLAAALHIPVITVERVNEDERYGPLAPPSEVIRLSQDDSTVDGVVSAVKEMLGQSCCHVIGDTPDVNNGIHKVQTATKTTARSKVPAILLPMPRLDAPLLFSSVGSGSVLNEVVDFYSSLVRSRIGQAVYVPFRTRQLGTALERLGDLGVAGLSVTQPFKREILEYITESSEAVAAIGSANTLYWNNGWRADNTDWLGAMDALDELWNDDPDIRGHQTALIYGAGGAARAIAYGLKKRGISVVISARNINRASEVMEDIHLDGCVPPESCFQLNDIDLFVNATSLGADGGRSIEFFEKLVPRSVKSILDVVISSERTSLEMLGAQRKCHIGNGWSMLRHQAYHQIDLFCTQTPKLGSITGVSRRSSRDPL